MTLTLDTTRRDDPNTATLDFHSDPSGYTVVESNDRFWRESIAERALRLTAMVLIIVGYAQWFFPNGMFDGDDFVNRTVILALFTATGILLYLFASRGFRRQLRLDVSAGVLIVARVNTRDRSLGTRRIVLKDIQSIFVCRAHDRHKLAMLKLRLRGQPGAVVVMRGSSTELETLHARLCLDARMTQTTPARPRRPQRQTPRPQAAHAPKSAFSGAATPNRSLFSAKASQRRATTA